MLYRALKPLIFRLDAEAAHGWAMRALSLVPAGRPAAPDPMLHSVVAGIAFPSPVGLAAGFDKDGHAAHRLHRFGFGFAEIGTLTPLPQPGNPRPRLFRLAEDGAVINRMGFNSGGQKAALTRIRAMPRAGRVIGINIGANKDTADRIADYAAGAALLAPHADFLTINISSPNTPGLRDLQAKAALIDLLDAVTAARDGSGAMPPVFLKVAPDLAPAEIDDIAVACIERRVAAIIIGNTTVSRPALRSAQAGETGGLSGAPLHDLALQRLRDFRRAVGGQVPLIGAGGIANADQAYARICAGASLVELYSALVYEGPYLPARINAWLKARLKADGFANVAEAVGSERAG